MQMISNEMIALLNYRIQQEELSSRLYWAMSQWLDKVGYIGAAKLWAKYSKEETEHAHWAYEFLQDLDILPLTPALEEPPQLFEGLSGVIEATVLHEEEVTRQCEELARAAMAEGSFLVYTLAHKYVAEQREELKKSYLLKDRLEEFGNDSVNMRLFDKELGEMAG